MNNNFISSSEYAIRSGRVRFSWKEKKIRGSISQSARIESTIASGPNLIIDT